MYTVTQCLKPLIPAHKSVSPVIPSRKVVSVVWIPSVLNVTRMKMGFNMHLMKENVFNVCSLVILMIPNMVVNYVKASFLIVVSAMLQMREPNVEPVCSILKVSSTTSQMRGNVVLVNPTPS